MISGYGGARLTAGGGTRCMCKVKPQGCGLEHKALISTHSHNLNLQNPSVADQLACCIVALCLQISNSASEIRNISRIEGLLLNRGRKDRQSLNHLCSNRLAVTQFRVGLEPTWSTDDGSLDAFSHFQRCKALRETASKVVEEPPAEASSRSGPCAGRMTS